MKIQDRKKGSTVNVGIRFTMMRGEGRRMQLQCGALYGVVLRGAVTPAGLRCTDKDDDGAVITAAFIACVQREIAAVKASVQSRNAGYARLIRDILTAVLHVTKRRDNDVYRSHKSYRLSPSPSPPPPPPHTVDPFTG